MDATHQRHYSLRELATKTGAPPRTIRFYIAKGLLAGPEKAGRSAVYGAAHLERIAQIRHLQAAGHTLSVIAQRLDQPAGQAVPPSVAWRHYEISPDVVVTVREDTAPWRVRQIHDALRELRGLLNQPSDHGGKES
jgi:DNA-binding transcriptional MerR regulator